MSNVSGSFAVNVEFRDSTTSSGVQSLKTIALRETTEYTTGVVVIVSATAGTGSVSLGTLQDLYRDSQGNLANVNAATRVAFSWRGATSSTSRTLTESNDNTFKLFSRNEQIAVTGAPALTGSLTLSGGSGTGTYTVILYGDS